MLRLTESELRARGYDPVTGRRLSPPAPDSCVSRRGATAGEQARAAVAAVNVAGASGCLVSDDVREPRGLSPGAMARLQPEQRLQVEIVRIFRPLLRPGARLFGTNGELPGGGKLQTLRATIRRDMGYMRGTPDLCARRPGFLGWLECKVDTAVSDEQATWAVWAQDDCGDGYCVVDSIESAGAILRIWSFLR